MPCHPHDSRELESLPPLRHLEWGKSEARKRERPRHIESSPVPAFGDPSINAHRRFREFAEGPEFQKRGRRTSEACIARKSACLPLILHAERVVQPAPKRAATLSYGFSSLREGGASSCAAPHCSFGLDPTTTCSVPPAEISRNEIQFFVCVFPLSCALWM